MVTPLQSVRLQSAQLLLKALKENEPQSETSNTATTLLRRYGIDTSGSSSQTLSALLSSLSPAATETPEPVISNDITTASFMAGMKQSLDDMAETAGTSTQAKSMLAALEAGTLTVTDPLSGVTIKAWDTDSAGEKDTESKIGTATEKSGWSAFFEAHLSRGSGAAFTKTTEGSYVDKITGDNAYFGTVGSQYVYLTWPQAKTAS